MTTHKTCKKCTVEKPLAKFPKCAKARDGQAGSCYSCAHSASYNADLGKSRKQSLERAKSWKENNRDRWRELKKIQGYRRTARKNGLTLEEYLAIRETKLNARTEKQSDLKLRKCRSNKCPLLRANYKLDYLINKDYYLSKSKKYYAENTNKSKLKTSNWKKNNPAKKTAQDFRRRTKFANVVQDLTNAQWKAIKEFYNNECAYCGQIKKLTMDHLIPVDKGGAHTANNIVPACQSCNSAKGNRASMSPTVMHNVI